MSHFALLVIGDDVHGQLAQDDENLRVPQYKAHVDTAQLLSFAQTAWFFGELKHAWEEIPTLCHGDLRFLQQRLHDWTGKPTGIDMQGLYYMSTFNPNGRWDSCRVDGGWPLIALKPDVSGNVRRVNSSLKTEVLQPVRPAFLNVLKFGRWHRIESSLRWIAEEREPQPGSQEMERALQEWDELLADVPDDTLLTAVDCHT